MNNNPNKTFLRYLRQESDPIGNTTHYDSHERKANKSKRRVVYSYLTGAPIVFIDEEYDPKKYNNLSTFWHYYPRWYTFLKHLREERDQTRYATPDPKWGKIYHTPREIKRNALVEKAVKDLDEVLHQSFGKNYYNKELHEAGLAQYKRAIDSRDSAVDSLVKVYEKSINDEDNFLLPLAALRGKDWKDSLNRYNQYKYTINIPWYIRLRNKVFGQ